MCIFEAMYKNNQRKSGRYKKNIPMQFWDPKSTKKYVCAIQIAAIKFWALKIIF